MNSPHDFLSEDFNQEIRLGPVEPMTGTERCFSCARVWARSCMQECGPQTVHVRTGPAEWERREVPTFLCPECKVDAK
jgi:hypothetical protein